MSSVDALKPLLTAGLGQLGLSPAAASVDLLLAYVALLGRWNATYNLTAVRDAQGMVVRHILDSLSVAPFVSGDSLADVGSGAGLPGVPLAILEPLRPVVLIDANGKMARFLREVVRALALPNVRVEQQRVEAVTGCFECITARAFASLADMLTLGGHLLAPNGRWLALKGRFPDDEIAALPTGFVVRESRRLDVPGLDAERHLITLARA